MQNLPAAIHPTAQFQRLRSTRTVRLLAFAACLLFVAAFALTGCTVIKGPPPGDAPLVADPRVFEPRGLPANSLANREAAANREAIPQPDEVLALTDEMRSFIDKIRGRLLRHPDPASYLARRLEREDFFPDGYYTETTHTAAGVFAARSGNCLSYTNLFVALARYAGLNVRFQFARVPANWSAQSGYLVRSRHISARVIQTDLLGDRAVTVDFNQVQNVGLFPHRLVTDEFALSSFYSNLAVDSLYEQRLREALQLLSLAHEVAPNNPDPWVNAAVVWSRAGNLRKAQSALSGALTVDPTNESALSGLARVFEARGDQERADWYRQTIVRNRDADPYYHFARARAAFDNDDLDSSRTHISRAITLRKSVGHFHYLAGVVHYRLGDFAAARTALEAAQTVRSPVSSAKREHTLRLLADIGPDPQAAFRRFDSATSAAIPTTQVTP